MKTENFSVTVDGSEKLLSVHNLLMIKEKLRKFIINLLPMLLKVRVS
jgi:hypothetical protein